MEGKALRKKTNLTLVVPDGHASLAIVRRVWRAKASTKKSNSTLVPPGKRVNSYQETDIRRSHSPGPRLGGFRGKP